MVYGSDPMVGREGGVAGPGAYIYIYMYDIYIYIHIIRKYIYMI